MYDMPLMIDLVLCFLSITKYAIKQTKPTLMNSKNCCGMSQNNTEHYKMNKRSKKFSKLAGIRYNNF
ncbi:MAG: hypothetical protein EBT92_16430 [Planctomycetes bacterium]|nr:hypothetical protein [Planctomycetota bacterium]